MQYRLPRHSDAFILEQLTKLGRKYCKTNWSISVRLRNASGDHQPVFSYGSDKQGEPSETWEANPVLKTIAESRGSFAERFGLQIDNHEVFVIERDISVAFDKAGAAWNRHDGHSHEPHNLAPRLAVAAEAAKLLGVEAKRPQTSPRLDNELGEFVEARDAALARLEEIYARFTQDLTNYRKDTDERLRQGEEALRARREKDEAELDAIAKRNEAALQAREELLKKRLAEIDDRDSLHARRELRKSIIGKLEERNKEFTLTSGTRRLRWPVAVILGLVALVLGFLLAQSVWVSAELFGKSGEWTVGMTYMLVKQSLLGAGFLSVVWYAIRWSNQWFREHADEEFKSKAMILDIERASWVVETATDWRRANKTDIPEVLVDRLTQDLFVARKAVTPATPDLASAVLGASSKAKLKLGDQAEVEIGRRGLKQLRNDLEKS